MSVVLSVDPFASMGGLWAAWALLTVTPGPVEPEARNGFPSGKVSSISDFPTTRFGTSRAAFRLDEFCSSNCAPGLEGFNFSLPRAAEMAAPFAHGLRNVSHDTSAATRATLDPGLVDFVPHFAQFPPFGGTLMDNRTRA